MENCEVVFFDDDNYAIGIIPEGTPVEVTDEIYSHLQAQAKETFQGATFLTAAETRELIRKLSEAVDNVENP